MAKFAMLERRQELEMKTERLVLEEQLAVAHARERAYALKMLPWKRSCMFYP